MAEAGRSGSEELPAVSSLERTLDQAVDLLRQGEQTSRSRALVIEALRLRDVVGAWRSSAPPPDVREDVIERVQRLAHGARVSVEVVQAVVVTPAVDPQLHLQSAQSPRLLPAAAASTPQRQASSPALAPLDLGRTVLIQRTRTPAGTPAETPARLPMAGTERTMRIQSSPEFLPELLVDPGDKKPQERRSAEPAPAPPPRGNDVGKNIPALHLDDEVSSSYRGGDLERTQIRIPLSELTKQLISVWSLPQPEGLDSDLVMIRDPYSKQADAYRALRRKLGAGAARTIAVTSALPREGKTICAVNLAFALAEASPRNILVVEANIRSPGLAALLKFEPPRCFTEQLTRDSKDPLDAWVVIEQLPPNVAPAPRGLPDKPQVPRNNFRSTVHLLAVDARKERPRMLDAVAFSMGIESLKHAGYEYIIIDTPPVLGATDMNVIGDVVDGVLLTAVVKRSTRRSIRDAIEQLKPVPVLGVVMLDT